MNATNEEVKPVGAEQPVTAPHPREERPKWPDATVALTHPVKGADGEDITALTFLEPDVEALERLEDLDVQDGERIKIRHLRYIAAALSRQPDEVIKRINARDFAKVTEAITPFLEYAVRTAQEAETS